MDTTKMKTPKREKRDFEQATEILKQNFKCCADYIDPKEFHMGLNVELEHGMIDPETNITHDDPVLTGKIAIAHLKELPDYYTRLAKMEAEGEAANGSQEGSPQDQGELAEEEKIDTAKTLYPEQ